MPADIWRTFISGQCEMIAGSSLGIMETKKNRLTFFSFFKWSTELRTRISPDQNSALTASFGLIFGAHSSQDSVK